VVAKLAEAGEEGRVLAGGQSLIPMMKLRLASPSYLVDINKLTELAYVRCDNGHLAVGALARHAEIAELETSPTSARSWPTWHLRSPIRWFATEEPCAARWLTVIPKAIGTR